MKLGIDSCVKKLILKFVSKLEPRLFIITMPYALRTCEEEYIGLYRAYLYSWLKDIVMYVPTKNKLLANPFSNVVNFYDAPGHDRM